jgi:signal peptidase
VVTLEPIDEDVTMDRRTIALPPGEEATATASVPAPPPGTDRTVTITEHRYIQLFPQSVLVGLHDWHPLLALGALNLLIGISILGFVGGLIGFDRVRFRNTSRDVPVSVVVRRWFR